LKLNRRSFLALLAGGLAALALDSSLIEPHLTLSLEHVVFHLGVNKPLRILHVTDLHFGSTFFTSPVYGQVLSVAREVKPDLVALTGDLVSKASATEEALRFIEGLASIAPVYVVWGNWDHWELGGGIEEFREDLKGAGEVEVLENKCIDLGEVCMVGVDDPYIGLDRLDDALQGASKEALKILLAHSPQIIGVAGGRVKVVLAGHTHGGQVVLPLLGPLWVPLPRKYRRYLAGVFVEGGTSMYVSRGVGTSLLPVRFMCPPQVAVVEIEP